VEQCRFWSLGTAFGLIGDFYTVDILALVLQFLQARRPAVSASFLSDVDDNLPRIKLEFEVHDTASESFATIWRVGVVYFYDFLLGSRPLEVQNSRSARTGEPNLYQLRALLIAQVFELFVILCFAWADGPNQNTNSGARTTLHWHRRHTQTSNIFCVRSDLILGWAEDVSEPEMMLLEVCELS